MEHVLHRAYHDLHDNAVRIVADSLTSKCGRDFDEYVRRVLDTRFPYNPRTSTSRSVTNLWSGRSLRLFIANEWREGKIVSWTQSTTGPSSRTTEWDVCMQVGMDTFKRGDNVLVDSLHFATHYNGKEGKVMEYLEDEGRYKVRKTTENKFLSVKPKNLKALLSWKVNRMNIEGGGTLLPLGERNLSLISLEWLEPAFPAIALEEGATCPMCCSVETSLCAADETLTEKERECPICLETKTCRMLQCGHEVCSSCWDKWGRAAWGMPIVPPEIDPDHLQNECDETQRLILEHLSHTFGDTGSKSSDNDEAHKEATDTLKGYCIGIVSRLEEHAKSGEQGLIRFWQELRACSAELLNFERFITALLPKLPMAGLKILLHVLEEREDELCACRRNLATINWTEAQCKAYFRWLCRVCYTCIAEKYREAHNYRGAATWYERSVRHGGVEELQNMAKEDGSAACGVSKLYELLGSVQQDAGFLSAALENYDVSMKIIDDASELDDTYCESVRKRRANLLREMKQWTGSSRKLTPGC